MLNKTSRPGIFLPAPDYPDGSIWPFLEQCLRRDPPVGVALTPEQIQLLIGDIARLTEDKNALMRRLWSEVPAVDH
jgi:hypothetical protein